MSTIRTNLVPLLLLLGLSVLCIELIEGLIPDQHALLWNFILVPLVLGSCAGFVLKGSLGTKLVLLAALPLVHLLYLGGDPAKPGLENVLAAGEFAFMCLGAALAHAVSSSRGTNVSGGD